MKKYMQTIANMYDRMNTIEPWSYDFVRDCELNALKKLQVSDLPELKKICSEDCIGTLILKASENLNYPELDEFYRVMLNLRNEIPTEVFKYIIDYYGESSNINSPVDYVSGDFSKALNLIDAFYDRKFYILYTIRSYEACSYTMFPTAIHFIIGNDKVNGKYTIFKALSTRHATKKEFDFDVLNKIWEYYYGKYDEQVDLTNDMMIFTQDIIQDITDDVMSDNQNITNDLVMYDTQDFIKDDELWNLL